VQETVENAAIGVGGPSSTLAESPPTTPADVEVGPPGTTPHGSRCAKSWTPDWIAVVETREHSLDRPICGARLMSGNPCTLVSTHSSGRCRYHGGFDLTGAPEGNRNAVLHNLYSRRLMPCGPHCPVWQSCPLTFSLGKRESKQRETVAGPAGRKRSKVTELGTSITSRESAATVSFGSTFSSPEEKVEARFIPSGYAQEILALNPTDRPICPYEQTEYNTAVSDALQRVPDDRTRAYARHVAHQLALAQVMVTRAGLALREAEFTKPTVITGEKYHMTTPKVSPALTAYEKLERAWRRLLIDFHRLYPAQRARPVDEQPYQDRTQSDTRLDPDAQTKHYQSMPRPSVDEFYGLNQKDPEPGGTTQEAGGVGGPPATQEQTAQENPLRQDYARAP